jgi:uncharacterized membrane protein
MKIDNRKILIVIVLLTLFLFPVALFTEGTVRIALGFLFIIFFPGYTLISALFPKQQDLSGVERIALSFGTSIAIVPLIGLILNYTPWGIRLSPILIAIGLFIVLMSIIAWFRYYRLTSDERLHFTLKTNFSAWSTMTALNKGLSIILIIAIIVAIGALTYSIISPRKGEKYTEFYILGPEGKAENYPRQLRFNEPAQVVIGLINHEQQPASYQVKVKIRDIIYETIDVGTLSDGQKYEKGIIITPKEIGKNQKIEFWLYMNENDVAYFEEPLYLYVDVVTSAVIDMTGKSVEYSVVRQDNKLEVIIGGVNKAIQATKYRPLSLIT